MQVALTCTHTCLLRGRKLSPNRRESNATSVVFIDFGSNVGYIHMSYLGLDSHIGIRETLIKKKKVSGKLLLYLLIIKRQDAGD